MPLPPALSFPKLWPAYEPGAVPEDPVHVRPEHEVWQLHKDAARLMHAGQFPPAVLAVFRTTSWLVGVGSAPASGLPIGPTLASVVDELAFATDVVEQTWPPCMPFEVLPDRHWAGLVLDVLIWLLEPTANRPQLPPVAATGGRSLRMAGSGQNGGRASP